MRQHSSARDDIDEDNNILCETLLEKEQAVPTDTLFDDDIFDATCNMIEGRNEEKIIQDIARLLTPSAQALGGRCDGLKCLIESVNEGWNNSNPFIQPRPQPDYTVGFRWDAFSELQLEKLAPFIGDIAFYDQSYFRATFYMYFPFFTSEVKCGAAGLDIADLKNAYSMTLAVRAVVELFRLVKREKEIDRKTLAFSVSHDDRSVRIYGHYAVIDTCGTTFYRHPIHNFNFTALDGKNKWTTYKFTKNVYDTWMPSHFKRICFAIDDIPLNFAFDVPIPE